ncbi:MAG: type II toxin-antitoxin system PemK/MazF family toxin [Methylomicrobium sp.]|nr:type II toxin-antitoxin system PemK/MazF family toxin [Methylomicrobium sp.]
MKGSGCIALTPFPYTDLSGHKMRPVLLLRQVSVPFDDWLVCMVSSQLRQADEGLDELILPTDSDFRLTGLKAPSVLRLSRLAVLEGSLMIGSIGSINDDRLWRIKQRLSTWIQG